MKLLITRHGETNENKEKIVQGQIQGTLSALGIEQAKKLAERLKDENIDVILSSDLARAADTAKEIAKFHPETPIRFVKNLREINLGKIQGVNKNSEKFKEWIKMRDDLNYNKKMGIELPSEFWERARTFLDNLKEDFSGKNVLLVGHIGINKQLIGNLLKKDPFKLEKIPNTSLTIFEINDDEVKQILFNCIKHLE